MQTTVSSGSGAQPYPPGLSTCDRSKNQNESSLGCHAWRLKHIHNRLKGLQELDSELPSRVVGVMSDGEAHMNGVLRPWSRNNTMRLLRVVYAYPQVIIKSCYYGRLGMPLSPIFF